jgi:hypothetical protein
VSAERRAAGNRHPSALAKADTGYDHAIDLSRYDLRLRPCCSTFGRSAWPDLSALDFHLTLRKEKAQGHLAMGERQ